MIIRVKHNKDNPYFMLNRFCVEDDRLSNKAVGILVYLLSKPDHWQVREEDIAKRHTDGATSIRSGLKELKEFGYIVVEAIRSESGKILKWETNVYEQPQESKNDVEFPEDDQSVENPDCGLPTPWKTTPIVIKDSLVSKESKELKKNTMSPNGDDMISEDGKFNSPTEGSNNTPRNKTSYQTLAAQKLSDALLVKGKSFRKPNIANWAKTLFEFMEKTENYRKEIEPVLDWYIEHMDDEFMYHAYSAEKFCEKFGLIKKMMDDSLKKTNGHASGGNDDFIARVLALREESKKQNGK